jgi:hypothetical protein
VNQGTTTRDGRETVTYGALLPVVPGPLQVAVEGMAQAAGAAGQLRATLEVPAADGLVLSDLLPGDLSLDADEVNRREDVRLIGHTDTLLTPATDLPLYWETYGLALSPDSTTRYTVTVQLMERAGGRTPGAEVVRVLGRALGLRDEAGRITWQRERRLGGIGYAADVVTLRLPGTGGNFRLRVTVRDDAAGTSATSERGLSLVK